MMRKNCPSFGKSCEKCFAKLCLNGDIFRLRIREVPFIGLVVTCECLRADSAKVRAIREMPRPDNVAGVQRILGMVQYLGKFCLDHQISPSLLETSPAKTWSGSRTGPKREREHLSNSRKLCICHRYSVITTCDGRLWSSAMRLNTVLVQCYFNVGSRVENHFCTFWGAGDFSYWQWSTLCVLRVPSIREELFSRYPQSNGKA